ncbi:MAG: phosphoribosylamine--glycine ligase [Coriobacteriia bacterium]|nr:phosphoribosylamine--glycine ligase [Coriobacteriia bacterium]MCL2537014.1 phosphoribosylamine--glycine ligase [Coriobacteriia bacterium]
MNILVIGSGGREHAIVRGLAASPEVENIYVAPGNGGTALEEKAINVDLSLLDDEVGLDTFISEDAMEDRAEEFDQIPADLAASPELRFVRGNDIDLVVIGPEAPLVAGLADELRAANIPTFGPGIEGAMLEGSKQVSKDFMATYDIPTAAYGAFEAEEREAAFAYLADLVEEARDKNPDAPVAVIKADGLAAGKGVCVAATVEEARAAIEECFDGRFGEAGDTVVIEAALTGSECSMIAFVDGSTVLPLAPSQDHKRAYDGDRGPNTGGMGCYSPVPTVTEKQLDEMTAIMQRSADALVEEGVQYRGILYAGFMLTDDGPQILEFNVRFGDPETQVLLPRLKTDLAEVMMKTARGELAGTTLEFVDAVGVSVVLASEGYPGDIVTGFPITGIAEAQKVPGVQVFLAGAELLEDEHGIQELVTAGGRVLNVTALAPSFEEAIAAAYDGVGKIDFKGAFSRNDIAKRALS